MSKARARRPHRVTGPFCASNPTAPGAALTAAVDMSASVTMAVMAASARVALHAADGALPSGVNRAPAGERGVRYEMKSSALMRRTMLLVWVRPEDMTHPLR